MPASALAEAQPQRAVPPRRLAHVVVYESIPEARPVWDALIASAPASAYQTPEWLLPWMTRFGHTASPLFVAGFDAFGPVAFLALGRERRGGLTMARFLGMPDSNVGLGLFDPAAAWDAEAVRRLFAEAGRLGGIDLFWLANQPFAFTGEENPCLHLPHRPSPSLQHEAVLDGEAGSVLPRLLSAKARKHIRQKEAKLAAIGPVRHVIARDAAMAERIATALIAQRAARFGPTHRDEALVAFLRSAAETRRGGKPGLDLHGLFCDDTLLSAFAAASHAGRTSGMMVSFATDPDWARFSPGELLIARVVEDAARNGACLFDLGIGEARYKNSFCPIAVPLFDVVLGTGHRGRLAAGALGLALALKRRIKQDPRLWPWIERWRGRLRHRSGRGFSPGA